MIAGEAQLFVKTMFREMLTNQNVCSGPAWIWPADFPLVKTAWPAAQGDPEGSPLRVNHLFSAISFFFLRISASFAIFFAFFSALAFAFSAFSLSFSS